MKAFFKWGMIYLLIGMNLLFLKGNKEALSQTRGKILSKESIRRDPFALPSGVRPRSQGETPREVRSTPTPSIKKEVPSEETLPAENPLKLKALLISDSIRLATIGQTIVQEGDFIGGEKVLEIRSDGVILIKEGKTRTLRLEQSPVKLKVEEPSSLLSQ